MTSPNGRETINEYDAKGNLITVKAKVKDGYYDVKRYQYDVQSKVIKETQLMETSDVDLNSLSNAVFDQEFATRIQSTSTYEYYSNGQVKSNTDANGNKTTFEYNMDKKPTKKTDPLGNSTSYYYDMNGNILQEKNAKAVSTYL